MGFVLHLTLFVVALLSVQVVTSRAPGDGDDFCTDTLAGVQHPSNVKILMDSFNYFNLLPPHEGAVWQQLDLDDSNAPGEGTEVSLCHDCIDV